MAKDTPPDEAELTYARLMQQYGDRLPPAAWAVLREAVQAVVKTVSAVRAIPLGNGDAPLLGFSPVREDD